MPQPLDLLAVHSELLPQQGHLRHNRAFFGHLQQSEYIAGLASGRTVLDYPEVLLQLLLVPIGLDLYILAK